MKNFITTIILLGIAGIASAQVSFGLRLGASPSVQPGTHHMFVNRQDPANEGLFNIRQVNYSEQIGLMVRTEMDRFWFMAELMYGRKTSGYTLVYTYDAPAGQQSGQFMQKSGFFELPVSAGVKLGMIEIFSGFVASRDISMDNELTQLNGYTTSGPQMRFGWHSGAGVNFGHILVDIRYAQEFWHYGKGHFLNGQELILKGAPGRFVVTTAVRI